LQWRSKEPSWRRIGRRFVADMATRRFPSYSVEIVGQGYRGEPFVTTLYTAKLSTEEQNWWYTKRLPPTVPESTTGAPLAMSDQAVTSEALAMGQRQE
jgi:hypothetical protein